MTVELSNQIRGLMKTFGLVVPSSKGGQFEANVRRLLADHDGLEAIILPVLEAWRSVRIRAADLGRQLLAGARRSRSCQLLMTIFGVGAVTATAFTAAIEDPATFKTSRSVGAWLGLTTRRYQSGEVDYDGHISRRGDAHLRGLRGFGPKVAFCGVRDRGATAHSIASRRALAGKLLLTHVGTDSSTSAVARRRRGKAQGDGQVCVDDAMGRHR